MGDKTSAVIEEIERVKDNYNDWCPRAFEYYCDYIIEHLKSRKQPLNDDWDTKKLWKNCGKPPHMNEKDWWDHFGYSIGLFLSHLKSEMGTDLYENLKEIIIQIEEELTTTSDSRPDISALFSTESFAPVLTESGVVAKYGAKYGAGQLKIGKKKKSKRKKNKKSKKRSKRHKNTKRRKSKKH